MRTDASAEEKTPVNLRIRASLKDRARKLGVNMSQVLEKSLEREIHRREQEMWLQENRQAIEAYNKRVEERGLALSAYRSF